MGNPQFQSRFPTNFHEHCRFSFSDDDTACHLMSISLRTATIGLRERRIKKGCEINDADQKGDDLRPKFLMRVHPFRTPFPIPWKKTLLDTVPDAPCTIGKLYSKPQNKPGFILSLHFTTQLWRHSSPLFRQVHHLTSVHKTEAIKLADC